MTCVHCGKPTQRMWTGDGYERRCLCQYVLPLPPGARTIQQAVAYYRRSGWTYARIAQHLGTTEASARVSMSRVHHKDYRKETR